MSRPCLRPDWKTLILKEGDARFQPTHHTRPVLEMFIDGGGRLAEDEQV